MNQGKWGLFALSCGALLGCSDPFAFTISKVKEDAPQEAALIELSSPQIYTRERLINDRRQEVAYLLGVLKKSEDIAIKPAIKRELESIVAIAVALQAGFNPIAGAQAQRQEDLAQLQQQALEIELQKRITILEAELSKLRADQATAEAGDAQTSVDTSKPITNPSDTANKQEVPSADAKAIQAELAPIITALKDLVEAINKDSGAAPKAANIEATPQEVFRDREAYREEIRRVLAQTELDDRHDQNGSALYSLRFMASVFPDDTKDVYGVASVTIKEPEFVEITKQAMDANNGHLVFDQIDASARTDVARKWHDLYKSWLAHLTMMLNQPPGTVNGQTRSLVEKNRIAMLGTVSGAFGVLPVDVLPDIEIALPIEEVEFIRYLIAYRDRVGRFQAAFEIARTEIEDLTLHAQTSRAPDELKNFRLVGSRETVAGAAPASSGAASVCQPRFVEPEIVVGKKLAPANWQFLQFLLLGKEGLEKPGGMVLQSLPPQSERVAIQKTLGAKYADVTAGLAFKDLLDPVAMKLAGLSSASTRLEIGASNQLTHNKLFAFAKRLIRNSQTLASLIVAVQEAGPSSGNNLAKLEELAQQFQTIYESSVDYVVAVMLANVEYEKGGGQRCSELLEIDRLADDLAQRVSVEEFAETLIESQNGSGSYAYSTGPRELVQTVSTVQTATEALQLVAALSAVLPTQGVSADLAASISKSATGKIEALERNPIVVGYSSASGPESAEGDMDTSSSSFGWVFGPRVTVDSDDKNLKLSQVLKSEPVQADIAVPGWWPELRLDVKTFWSGSPSRDIQAKGDQVRSESFTAALHNDRASMDRITDIVAGANWGARPTSATIRQVFPEVLNFCQADVAFQVVGSNLWRGAEVYLDGLAANPENIRVLPDMEGIAVTFAADQLRGILRGDKDHTLSVWTYDGSAQFPLRSAPASAADCGVTVAKLGIVSPLQSAIVGGAPLEIAIQGGLPPARDSVEIIGRGTNSDKYFVISDAPVIAPSGNVFVSTVPKEVLKLPDGSEIVTGLRIKTSTGTAAESMQVSEATGRLISYKDRPSLVIQVGKRDGTEAPLVITGVPPGFAKAYPQLVDGTVRLSATNVAKGLTASITLGPIPDGDPAKIGGRLAFDDVDADVLAALLKNEAIVLDISHNARDALKGVFPALSPTITLPKE